MLKIISNYKKLKKIKKEKPYNKLKTTIINNNINIFGIILSIIIGIISSFFLADNAFRNLYNTSDYIMFFIMFSFLTSLFSFFSYFFFIGSYFGLILKKLKLGLKKEIINSISNHPLQKHLDINIDEYLRKRHDEIFDFDEILNLENYTELDFFLKELKDIDDKLLLEKIHTILPFIKESNLNKDDSKIIFNVFFKKYKYFLENEIININTFKNLSIQTIKYLFNDLNTITENKKLLDQYILFHKESTGELININKKTIKSF